MYICTFALPLRSCAAASFQYRARLSQVSLPRDPLGIWGSHPSQARSAFESNPHKSLEVLWKAGN